MKILRYFILALFLMNLPGIALATLGPTLGSLLSYSSFLSVVAYYVFFARGKPNMWLLYVGMAYFIISGLQMYTQVSDQQFIILVVKFLILILLGNSFFKSVTNREILVFVALGASTVIFNFLFFADAYGRYSGFYLNPNAAGLVCIIGYSLTFGLERGKTRTLLQLLFSIAGFATFSRTFILLWVLISLISLKIDRKNVKILGLGLGMAFLILTFGELLNLGGARYQQFKGLLTDDTSTTDLQEGSRTETWSLFYEEILNHPFFGDGFGKFQSGGINGVGVHNIYLMIQGEAGIIALLLFICFVIYLLFWSYKVFRIDPTLFLISVSLAIYFLTSHNFFDSYFKLCMTLFVYQRIKQSRQHLKIPT